MVAEATWRAYLPSFFGPFLKDSWPTSLIMKKPKFQVLLKWFGHFLEASTFRQNIPKLREEAPPSSHSHFDFLCDLFETYLPAVLWFEKTKNSPSFELRLNFVYIQLFLLSSLNSAPYVKVLLSSC